MLTFEALTMAAVVAALPACATPLTLPASDFGRGAAIDRVWVNRVPQQFGILGTDHSRMAGALGAPQRVDEQVVVGSNKLVLFSATRFPDQRRAVTMYHADVNDVRSNYCQTRVHDYGSYASCAWRTTGPFYGVVARYKDVEMVIVGAGFGVAPTTVQHDVTAVATQAYVRYIRAACG